MTTRCLDCRALIPRGSRCRACNQRHELKRSARRSPSGWARQRTTEAILKRDMGMCRLCGGKAAVVDHIVPLARGGANEPRNLRSLCADCHEKVRREQFR